MYQTVDNLGALIKNARKQNNMTQEQLALQLGVTARHIMYIENSKQKPSYKLLFQLVHVLSIPTGSIFYPENDEENREPVE